MIGSYFTVVVTIFLTVFCFSWARESKAKEPDLLRHAMWGIVAVFAVAALYSILMVLSPDGLKDGGSTGMSTGVTTMALGIIGFVITGMTGMALASAWRAVDDSRKAQENIKASEEKIRMYSVRNMASMEAMIFQQRIKNWPESVDDCPPDFSEPLLEAIKSPDHNVSAYTLCDLVKNPEYKDGFKSLEDYPYIVEFVKLLTDSDTVDLKYQRSLYLILSLSK